MKKDFKFLASTFKNSIKTWDYFVNWDKVFSNNSQVEITLNKLNYLLGKSNLREEFTRLYKNSPDVVAVLPLLLAVRERNIEIIDSKSKNSLFYDFGKSSKNNVDDYYNFIKETGLVKLFKEDGVKNLVDYVIGVEVGLDSNGRKNRGGKLMERVVESYLANFCEERGFVYISQANAKKILKKWNYKIVVNKSSRSFDFAVFNPKSKRIKLFEVNFYNGGGSKLKSVCGEFKSLYSELKKQSVDFVWITDGLGWNTALRPLEEVYNSNDYVFNLKMVEEGAISRLDW